VSEWDYGRCKSFLAEVVDDAANFGALLERHHREDYPQHDCVSRANRLLVTLRKVKALLQRAGRSRA